MFKSLLVAHLDKAAHADRTPASRLAERSLVGRWLKHTVCDEQLPFPARAQLWPEGPGVRAAVNQPFVLQKDPISRRCGPAGAGPWD